MSEPFVQVIPCPRCETPMQSTSVRTDIWEGDRLFVVEDIPAQVCGKCFEQYYDEDVTDALRRLAEDKFPVAEIKREIIVPIYSLTGRIRTRTATPEPDYEQY